MSEADYAALITAAHRYLDAPVIVIWDNLSTRQLAAFRRDNKVVSASFRSGYALLT
jgi:hypothetical protein